MNKIIKTDLISQRLHEKGYQEAHIASQLQIVNAIDRATLLKDKSKQNVFRDHMPIILNYGAQHKKV